jgi:hypothetical protein
MPTPVAHHPHGCGGSVLFFGSGCSRSIWLACGAPMFLGSQCSRSIWFACGASFFSWLAALSLDLACLRRFLPWIGVLSFDLVLRFVFFLGSRRCALVSVCCFFVARGVCVCVCLRPLSRALLLTVHAIFPTAAWLPLFRGEKSAYELESRKCSWRDGTQHRDSTSSSSSHIRPLKPLQ